MQRSLNPLLRCSRVTPHVFKNTSSGSVRFVSTKNARTSAAVAAPNIEPMETEMMVPVQMHSSFHVPTIGGGSFRLIH